MSSSEFSNYLTVFEYSTVLVMYGIALHYIIRILVGLYQRARHISLKEKNGLSNLLIANLICWAILMGSAIPHVSIMIAHWRSIPGRLMNPLFIFWTTIITECMMAMIPYSLFFLTIDRILAIKWLNGYVDQHKLNLLVACFLSLMAVFVINFFAFCQILPALPEMTNCNVFACLMTNGNIVFIISKLFGGVLIIITGAIFLWNLRKHTLSIKANLQNSTIQHLNKIEPNTLIVLMLCTELGLNFLPQLLIFIIQTIIGHQIASIVGPINHFLNCFDALISALTYKHTLRRFFGTTSVDSSVARIVVVPTQPIQNPKRRVSMQQREELDSSLTPIEAENAILLESTTMLLGPQTAIDYLISQFGPSAGYSRVTLSIVAVILNKANCRQ